MSEKKQQVQKYYILDRIVGKLIIDIKPVGDGGVEMTCEGGLGDLFKIRTNLVTITEE